MTDTPRTSPHEGYELDIAKPGSPPRHSAEPEGSESDHASDTLTHPVTGEPSEGEPDTAGVG